MVEQAVLIVALIGVAGFAVRLAARGAGGGSCGGSCGTGESGCDGGSRPIRIARRTEPGGRR
jgi:hypothetical protein